MRRFWAWPLILGFLTLFAIAPEAAQAACTVPNQLTNGQTADASQVMANFNSVLGCVNGAPGGSTNALQFNAGSGTFGGLGPLTNGQIAIGSTGNAPQAGTLTAGPGIAITNGPGSIMISNGTAVYTPPKLTNFTWGNQPSGTTGADTNTGLAIYQPSLGSTFNTAVLWDNNALPTSTAFTVTVGANLSALYSGIGTAGLVIGDGTGKFVQFLLVMNGSYYYEGPDDWNSYTSRSSATSPTYMAPTINIIQINYDLTNFNVSAGSDINSLVPIGSFSASGFIGAPTQVGLFIWGYSENTGVTFFDYQRSDGKP